MAKHVTRRYSATSRITVNEEINAISYFCKKYKVDKSDVISALNKGRTVNQIFDKRIINRSMGLEDSRRKKKIHEAKDGFRFDPEDVRRFMRTQGWRV